MASVNFSLPDEVAKQTLRRWLPEFQWQSLPDSLWRSSHMETLSDTGAQGSTKTTFDLGLLSHMRPVRWQGKCPAFESMESCVKLRATFPPLSQRVALPSTSLETSATVLKYFSVRKTLSDRGGGLEMQSYPVLQRKQQPLKWIGVWRNHHFLSSGSADCSQVCRLNS